MAILAALRDPFTPRPPWNLDPGKMFWGKSRIYGIIAETLRNVKNPGADFAGSDQANFSIYDQIRPDSRPFIPVNPHF